MGEKENRNWWCCKTGEENINSRMSSHLLKKKAKQTGRKSKHLPPLVQLQENLDGFVVLSDGQGEVSVLKDLVAGPSQQLTVSYGVHPARRRAEAGCPASTGTSPSLLLCSRVWRGSLLMLAPPTCTGQILTTPLTTQERAGEGEVQF